MLMLIMFVGGAMSVITMALLSAFILAERVLPAGPWVARLPGVALIVWGGYIATLA
jgi:predicted metal-binding membrane protein